MRIPTIIAICAYLCACSLPRPGSEAPTLDALESCPSSETGCVMMNANLNSSDRMRDIKEHPAVLDADERVQSGDYGYIVVGVSGRLNNGVPGRYRLRLAYPNDMLGCNDFAVAALGANRSGGGRIA